MKPLLWSLLLLANLASAQQVLPDPTAPPPGAQPRQTETGEAAPTVQAPVLAEPTLQSILIGKKTGGRRLAVIDGQMLKVGDKMRDMIVVDIDENRVTLRQGKTTKVLKLFGTKSGADTGTAPDGVTK